MDGKRYCGLEDAVVIQQMNMHALCLCIPAGGLLKYNHVVVDHLLVGGSRKPPLVWLFAGKIMDSKRTGRWV